MRNSNNVKKRIEKRRKRKKRIKILLFISISLIVVCIIVIFNNNHYKSDKNNIITSNNKQTNIEKPIKDLPIKIETTPVTLNIVEKDNTKVIQATLKNDSEEIISKVILEVKFKDSGEVMQMVYEEDVVIGTTANLFSEKAPNSGKLEDVEILKYKISLTSGAYIEYDVELRQYNWS